MMKQVKFKFPVRIAAILFGLFLSVGAFAQSITVNGHVKDATGEPIIGATVLVPGTSNGAATDLDGNFTLNCNQGDKLQVSYVGYATQTVTASSNLVVTLVEDSKVLNDVVVIGYGRAKKSDLTGSVTAIKPDEKNHGLQTNAQDMIQGKIAGVNITTSSGQPGSGATIRIRGGSSFNDSGNDPLIVIDGLAMDNQGVKGLSNPLSMVNPNDIESFTVLKDASATAIYGSRGSNGVIIITTKKGRKDMAPKVSYNGNVSASIVKKYTNVLDGNQYRELVKEVYGEGSARYNLLGSANTDWQKQIYRTAISHDHNVTVQGGFKNVPYRLSVGYTDQNGILKTSNFKRVTTSLNLSPSLLNDHLKFNINGKFMFAKNRYANSDAIGNAVSFDPTQPVTSSDARFSNFNGYWQWTQDAPYDDSAWPYSKIALATSNPVSMIEEKDDRANSYDYQGNVEVDYQIHGLEDLRLHMNFSGDWANGKQTTDYQPWGPSNFYYGNYGFTKENKYNLNYTAYIQYYKDFSEAHHFDIMGGYEWRHEKYWGNSNYYGLYPESSTQAGEKYNEQNNEWKSEHYLVSFYGRMNYIALDRYMLTATLRADGSSRFDKGHKWGYFPSVALGWKINEEAFLKDVQAVTEMKLRLGWGMTGQQEGIGDYTYIPTYNQTQSSRTLYPIYSDGYQYKPDAYNPNVKWETTTTWNAGIDFGFIRNRLTGSIDFYHRKTKDLLMEAPVAGMSNFSNKLLKNIGSMQNTGVEFSITGRPIQTTDWNWEITANATYNKNKVVELAGDGQPIKFGNVEAFNNEIMCHQVGQPMSMFWVYQQVYDQNGKPLQGVVVDRDANTIDDANDINVNPTALQKAYYDGITHNPFQKTVYVRTTLYTLTGGEALARVGAPEYFDTHSVELTPLGGGPALSDNYYIIGNVQGWSNTYEAATSLPFEHSDANVYDDPIFTIVLPAKYNDQNEREDTWFSILPGNDLDAFVGNDWSVLLGNNVSNGCEDLEGSLMTRADFGGDCNMMMPATDGATSYLITINVLEGTYSIQPLNEAGAIVPDPILYMTGSNYGWSTWVPLVPVCDDGAEAATGLSWLMVYLEAGEEFKFAPQPEWSGDFGMSAEVTSECGDVYDASSPDNIKMTKSGWYLLKVKNVDGARKVTFMAPDLYLIGNASPAGWSCETSGLFTVPTERNGQFVSPAFVAEATEDGGGVRMCVNLGEGIDWWRAEFIPVGGQISYRGNAGDQDRVKGNKGQKAYINFTLGSGIVK